MPKPSERRIIVKQCRLVTSGTGRNQKPYSIFELEATREDHTPIPEDMKLRAFEELPVGVPLDVTVERYDSEKYGPSYTVKLKGGGQGSPQSQISALAQRLADAEEKIARLAERVYASSTGPPTATPTEAPSPAASGEVGPSDDIPF